jgi:hypothetical protein
VIDDFAKDHLHGKVRSIRLALVWIDGRTGVMPGGSHHADRSGTHRAVGTR